jgi:hypothetical protein
LGLSRPAEEGQKKKRTKWQRHAGKGCTLGYDEDEDQLPMDELNPSFSGAFAGSVLSYDD